MASFVMGRGEKMRIPRFVFPALVLGTLLAVSPFSLAAEPSGNKSTAKDIAKKADETGQAIKNYTVAQRDEAIKNAKAALDDADRRIDRMERKLDGEWERMDQGARKRARATLEALRRERNEAAEWHGGGPHIPTESAVRVSSGCLTIYAGRHGASTKVRKRW